MLVRVVRARAGESKCEEHDSVVVVEFLNVIELQAKSSVLLIPEWAKRNKKLSDDVVCFPQQRES